MCERFFSASNNCAGISRYTTTYHRHQILHTHFQDSDESHRLAIGKFIYNNYVDSLRRISLISETFSSLDLVSQLQDGTFDKYLKAKAAHLEMLSTEPLEDQSRC